MRILKKQIKYMTIIIMLVGLTNFIIYNEQNNNKNLIMGGKKTYEKYNNDDKEVNNSKEEYDLEKYFRPSKLPILNNREYNLNEVYGKNPSDIKISNQLLKSPEDTILNYYSVLREASNPLENKNTGCGTIGQATTPYPVSYNFFTKSYIEEVSFEKYLKSFENILHTNLIKVEKIPSENGDSSTLKYFIEIETIEGSDSGVGYFAYYYGYIYIKEEDGKYKISKIDYYPENYLCAPYHGWNYDAELYVDVKYGGWCKLIKEKYPVEKDGYKKKVKFLGTDGKEYMILFYELTNGTDIEIAQYVKESEGKYKLIYLDPSKCLKKTPNN